MKAKRKIGLVAILVATIVIAACVRNPVTGKRQLMLVSERQEIAMGAEYDPQLVAAMGLYESPQLQAFIDEKVRGMGVISHRPHLNYHIRILDSPVVNAFAVPGGYIYLTRGILAHFNNEAELVGVIGHEMGHITARHSVARMSSQTLWSLALLGGMVVSEEFAKYGEVAMAGLQLLFLSYSRTDEREADRLGVEYTAKIGYDASKFAEFYRLLQRMQLASEHGGIPTFLSTHPDPGNRYNDVHKEAKQWQQQLNAVRLKVNAESYLSMIDGLVYGDDPRQGYVEGNTFYHPELLFFFRFPNGWKLQNSPLQVQISDPESKALMVLMHAPGNSLQDAAETSLAQLELSVISRETRYIGGLRALSFLSEIPNDDPDKNQKVRSNFIDLGGQYLAFHAVSFEKNFHYFLPQFNSTLNGFSRLREQSKINVLPELIRVRRIASTGTLSGALRAMNVAPDRLDEIAMLNNMSLTDRVQAGQYIKVVAAE